MKYMVLACISLVVLYSIYMLRPFFGMEQKIRNREEILAKQDKSMVTDVQWTKVGPEHHFWTNTTSCKDFKTRFAKVNTLPIRALTSYPGSGNTWVRYLIEGATGVYTGSIFNDSSILRAGHYGEGRDYKDGSTIMQKTHHRSLYQDIYKGYDLKWRETHVMTFQGRAVLVVRNPFKAILSYWNLFTTKSHTNTINEHSFDSIKFKDFVFTGASRWFELINDWINLGNDVYFIFYEELVEDPVKEIRKLMDYLGFPADEGRLSCLSHHLQGSFKRTVHQLTDPFTPNHHRKIRNVIKKAQQMIKEKTGKDIPIDKYEYYKN